MADTVQIPFDADFKRAAKNVTKFAKNTAKSVDSISRSFNVLNSLAVGFAGIVAGQKILGSLKSVTDAASIQEDAITQLNTALLLTGELTQENSKGFQAFASELQRTSRVGDEVALQQLAIAKSFGVTNDQAKELVKAAVDLSQATGITLESAVRNLGKTYGGLTGELGEVVPALKNLSAEQLKAGEGVKFITERFGGAAQAALKTFSGASDQAKNTIGDFTEELGFLITKNPLIIKGINEVNVLFNKLGKVVSNNRDDLIDFVNKGFLAIVSAVPTVIGALDDLNRGFLKVQKGVGFLRKLGISLAANVAKIAADTDAQKKAIEEAAAADFAAIDEGLRASKTATEQRSAGIQKLVNLTQSFVDETKKAADAKASESNKFNENTDKQIQKVSEFRNELNKQIEDLFKLKGLEGFEVTGKVALELTNFVLQGAKGAQSLIAKGVGAAASAAFGPAFGPVAEQLTSVLQQGPDAVRGLVKSFVDAIPDLIIAIAESIPVLVEQLIVSIIENLDRIIEALVLAAPIIIEGLVKAIPTVIQALIDRFDEIALAFIRALIKATPDLIKALVVTLSIELVKAIPAIVETFAEEFLKIPGQFLEGLLDGLKDGIENLFKELVGNIPGLGGGGGFLGDVVGGIGGVVSDIGGSFGFAEGGLVPSGFPNDTFNARLSSNELVVPENPTNLLLDFLNREKKGETGLTREDLQRALASDPGQPTVIQLQMNDNTLASALINLSRRGVRTS